MQNKTSNAFAHRLHFWLQNPLSKTALAFGRMLHRDGLREAEMGASVIEWAKRRLAR